MLSEVLSSVEAGERAVVHEPDICADVRLAHALVAVLHGEGVAAPGLDRAVRGDAEVKRHRSCDNVELRRDLIERSVEGVPRHESLLDAYVAAVRPHDACAMRVVLPAGSKRILAGEACAFRLVDYDAHFYSPSMQMSSRSIR